MKPVDKPSESIRKVWAGNAYGGVAHDTPSHTVDTKTGKVSVDVPQNMVWLARLLITARINEPLAIVGVPNHGEQAKLANDMFKAAKIHGHDASTIDINKQTIDETQYAVSQFSNKDPKDTRRYVIVTGLEQLLLPKYEELVPAIGELVTRTANPYNRAHHIIGIGDQCPPNVPFPLTETFSPTDQA